MAERYAAAVPIDPALNAFVAEQRAANDALLARSANLAPPGAVDPVKLRRNRLYRRDGSLRPPLVDGARDDRLATALGEVLVRRFAGSDERGIVVHFHGGGWIFGSVYEQDPLLAAMAARTGATVLSIDYPLAPESELPQAIAIASAALASVIAQHPGRNIALAGESAGAHLALCGVLGLDAAQRRRIVAMSLAYGIYDLSMTPSQRRWGSEFLGLSTDWLEYFYALALPGRSREARSNPAWSPLYADLAGLPPAILTIGARDPLLDDTLFIFERWHAAGNLGELHVYPEAPHGFNHLATQMAARANETMFDFLSRHLAPPTSARR